jgi:quercetin dioxygenase-like cupin family protein
MRRYRFDVALGRPISEHGSRGAVLCGLTTPEPHAGLRAACFHLEAGGLIGRHAATMPQLFCVVAGGGWVSGEDGTRVPIRTGEAAWWDRDEVHESGTDTGMTAIVLEGNGDFRFSRLAPWPDPGWLIQVE